MFVEEVWSATLPEAVAVDESAGVSKPNSDAATPSPSARSGSAAFLGERTAVLGSRMATSRRRVPSEPKACIGKLHPEAGTKRRFRSCMLTGTVAANEVHRGLCVLIGGRLSAGKAVTASKARPVYTAERRRNLSEAIKAKWQARTSVELPLASS